MLNNVNYNIIDLDITNGQNGHRIAGGKDYIILLDSPVNAEVYITIGDRNNAKIPLKNDFAVKYQNGLEVYVYSTAVEGEKIKLATSNRLSSGIEIITNPQVDEIGNIGTLNNISDVSNIINPLLNVKNVLVDSVAYSIAQDRNAITNENMFSIIGKGFILCNLFSMQRGAANDYTFDNVQIKINDSIVFSGASYSYISTGAVIHSKLDETLKFAVNEGDKISFSYSFPSNLIFSLSAFSFSLWQQQNEN